jgi:GT2 family glycosyltransferase
MTIRSTELSIIIVTWNARGFAWECLDSLRSYKSNETVEVIVVDNASVDGTPALIEKEFPWVRLINNSSNVGFAKANNIGIKASVGKYVSLINSDVKIPHECLGSMYAFMESTPSAGMLGPQMLCPNGLIGRSYMRFPTIWRAFCNALGLHRILRKSQGFGGILMTEFDNNQTTEVDVLNGWFLMVRRQAVEEVGMLDEQFFMYGEDIDWSYRFHKAGWKRMYFAEARAFHYGGASSDNAPIRFYIERQRANIQFWKKHRSWLGVAACHVLIYLNEMIRIVGHSARFLTKKSLRADSVLKVKRSWACLSFLFGRRPKQEASA